MRCPVCNDNHIKILANETDPDNRTVVASCRYGHTWDPDQPDKSAALWQEQKQTLERPAEYSRDHIGRAKQIIIDQRAKTHPDDKVTHDNLYVVWFSFTLGNWKCLISSDAWTDTSYYEVTYNSNKGETYVDWYTKNSNTLIKD